MAWLVEDQYLRRGLRLKSVSTAFQQLTEMPGSRRRTRLTKHVYADSNFFQRA
ncbi:hypothetical protein Nizo2259_1762 [Lactiplantibacillus plantarum]|nr:hypothetical protein Nizo2259_1762 [Lactiplantibacillus plantarum]KZU02983.1 hypothetical protein Nizo2262_2819 [Lactiplantibacillus plantarum]KZU85888.1 hypothetical protein Nizo3894_2907 [Lactiplantibacillus plantarum]